LAFPDDGGPMSTVFSPIFSPGADYESKLVKVIHAPAPEQVEELERILIVPENEIYQVRVFDNVLTRYAKVLELRMKRLRWHRALWGTVSALCLIYLAASFPAGISYEPAAALSACSVGVFAVFSMKIADAKPKV